MTDEALIARLRESLDELTAPATAAQPLEVPHLDTVVVPLTDLRPANHRWMATVGVLAVAAAALVAVVLIRSPQDPGESVGTPPGTDEAPVTSAVAVDAPEGGIPKFAVDLPGATIARGPELQKSGSQSGVHRRVFAAADGSDDRVLVIASYPNNAQAYGADTKSFDESSVDSPDTGLREHRASHPLGGAGPEMAEFLHIGDQRSTWMQTRGFSDEELSRLVNGAVLEGSDGSFVITDTTLNLIDVGASAYGSGELWWSRSADYELADGSRINISVSTGTAADRFNDALAFDTETVDLDGQWAYAWTNKLVNGAGDPMDMWGNTDVTYDVYGIEWHDDANDVVVRVTGNIPEAQLLELAHAVRLIPVA